jgi:hypothetical protein
MILNKQLQTADKEWSSSLGDLAGVTTLCCKRPEYYEMCGGVAFIMWCLFQPNVSCLLPDVLLL